MVGSGWASHAFLKRCETDAYEVICVSPRPYFVFTPMLAFATVGGVTTGSIVEPIRAANPGANYVEGEMTDINVIDKNIRVRIATPIIPPSLPPRAQPILTTHPRHMLGEQQAVSRRGHHHPLRLPHLRSRRQDRRLWRAGGGGALLGAEGGRRCAVHQKQGTSQHHFTCR